MPPRRGGTRLVDHSWLQPLLGETGVVGKLISKVIGPGYRPVRALLFDKSASDNWALGFHQDRTIAVRGSAVPDGYSSPTIKQGVAHLQPPFSLIERMITVRVHLDAVDGRNAPLLVVPGSHLLGRVPVSDVARVWGRCGHVACHAKAGDVWIYHTAILHGSDPSETQSPRRVIQADYSCDELPAGISWRGI